jgi:hypothetical protein
MPATAEHTTTVRCPDAKWPETSRWIDLQHSSLDTLVPPNLLIIQGLLEIGGEVTASVVPDEIVLDETICIVTITAENV